MVYNRWGRVGVKGQDKLLGPFTSQENAINDFETKFFAKTKNQWSNRRDFISYPKHYTWLEMDYNEASEHTVMSYSYSSLVYSFKCLRVRPVKWQNSVYLKFFLSGKR